MRKAGTSRPVLHVTDALLPYTETFVQQRLRPGAWGSIALAWRRVPALEVPCPSIILQDRRARPLGWVGARAAVRLGEEYDLLQAVRRIRPVLIHAHFGPVGLRALHVAKLLGVPLVVSFYGFDVGDAERVDRKRKYEALFRYAYVTAEGPFLLRRLRSLGARRGGLLPLSLPDWCMERPVTLARQGEGFRLLQVCRLVPKKGVDLSIRALALARAAGIDARLTIVGDGPERSLLEGIRKTSGMEAFVKFEGARPYAELPRWFDSVDAVIQPSRTGPGGDTEGGHPTVVLEAQARALPVVATTHGDIPMVVQDGRTGLLVAEDDVTSLASAIASLVRQDRRKMGELGRARALRRHAPLKVRRIQETVYRVAVRSG
jgi:colanic acid/amylovoran biosynthesis glycosyltransferase